MDSTEEPTRIPDSTEVWELLRQMDKLAQTFRARSYAQQELAEGYKAQGDKTQSVTARDKAFIYMGFEGGCDIAARKLALLFGIDRPGNHDDRINYEEGDHLSGPEQP